jgi:hypothetical protein
MSFEWSKDPNLGHSSSLDKEDRSSARKLDEDRRLWRRGKDHLDASGNQAEGGFTLGR